MATAIHPRDRAQPRRSEPHSAPAEAERIKRANRRRLRRMVLAGS